MMEIIKGEVALPYYDKALVSLIDKPSGLRTIKTTICASLDNLDCTNLICLVYKMKKRVAKP